MDIRDMFSLYWLYRIHLCRETGDLINYGIKKASERGSLVSRVWAETQQSIKTL